MYTGLQTSSEVGDGDVRGGEQSALTRKLKGRELGRGGRKTREQEVAVSLMVDMTG